MPMQIFKLENPNQNSHYQIMIVIAPDAKTATHIHPLYGYDGVVRHPSCLGEMTESKWYETPIEYQSDFCWCKKEDVLVTHIGVADEIYNGPLIISAS